jgi:hypothetical protein
MIKWNGLRALEPFESKVRSFSPKNLPIRAPLKIQHLMLAHKLEFLEISSARLGTA